MGSELLGESLSLAEGVGEVEKPTLSYTQFFWKCLPIYLALGMTSEEFWNCDPMTYQAYREKQKIELEIENQRLWLEGLYQYQNILLTAPAMNAIKPKQPRPYPNKPIDLKLDFGQKEEQKVEEDSTFAKVKAWADRVNKKMGNDYGNRKP